MAPGSSDQNTAMSRSSSVSPFTIATEADSEFAGMFQLDKSTFKDTLFDDVGVREFQLEYVVRDGAAGDEESAS